MEQRVGTNIRLPADLYDQIREVARIEDRSINAQITRFLRDALTRYHAEDRGAGSSEQPE